MALKASGTLSFSEIIAEAYSGETNVPTQISMNDEFLRALAKKTTANSTISVSDFYGKSKFTFENGDFSAGTLTAVSGGYELPGWDIYSSNVRLNGNSTVAGWPTPVDATDPPGGPTIDETPSPATYSTQLTNDLPSALSSPSRSLRLYNTGTVGSFGVAHGPYAVSAAPIALEANDQVSFYWKAAGANDAYDIFAYLVNTTNGNIIELINSTGADASATSPWTKVTKTITASQASPNKNLPDYKFVFISGSYDATGGTVTGADLYITMIEVKKWFQL